MFRAVIVDQIAVVNYPNLYDADKNQTATETVRSPFRLCGFKVG